MSGPFGLLPVGFVAKSAVESKADFDTSFAGVYGESLKSDPDGSIPAASSIGQEVAILTDSESSAWEVLGAIYAGMDPDQAEGPQLDFICAITGTFRKPAEFSSGFITCAGVDGTILPVGRVVTVTGLGTRFDSVRTPAGSDPHTPDATLQIVTATWATNTLYGLNALVTANGKAWQAIVSGTSAMGGGGPTGNVGTEHTDNTVTWYCVALSTAGVAIVPFEAEVTGKLTATKGQLMSIATPVSGWQTAYNTAAMFEGRDIETDAALRVRRVAELQAQGGGPANAIRADILAINAVVQCRVFVNDTDATVDSIPPHAVEVLIQAPTIAPTTNQELADAVWAAVGAGTGTHGNTSETVLDSSGVVQTVEFSRPVEVPIYVAVTVLYDATVWTGLDPTLSVTNAVKAAILNFGDGFQIGQDVRATPLAGAILDGAYAVDAAGDAIYPAPAGSPTIPGLFEVRNGGGTDGTLPYIGTAPGPVTSTNVVIGKRQIATFDPTNIQVYPVAGTP